MGAYPVKRVLIAGGSHSDIPLIKAVRAYGHYIITSGNRPDDLGHSYADEVALADFSDKEAMLSLAKRMRIDAIVSSANDFSLISCAFVAEQLGLPGFDPYETTLRLHHKNHFRALAEDLGLPCPKAKCFSDLNIGPEDLNGLQYPLIVKPVDLTGGKGVAKVSNFEELISAATAAFAIGKIKKFVIEPYFNGTLHSFSTFIRKQKIIAEHCDNEYSYLNPYLVSTSVAPATINDQILPRLRDATERMARSLSLVDGILHAQFLADGSEFTVIEYTRRCSGDLYAIPVKHYSGLDHADMIVRPSLGLPLPDPTVSPNHGYFSRHCAMAGSSGIFRGFAIDPAIVANIIDRFDLLQPGDTMRDHMVNKAAIFILKYDDSAEMNRKNQQLPSLIRVITDK
jgi:biotin carboxylase